MRLRLFPENPTIGWTPYAWLIYLGFYWARPLVVGDPWDLVRTALVTAAFLPLYFRTYWVTGRQAVPPAVGILALALVAAPGNGGAACFPIYAAGAVGQSQKRRVVVLWVAGIVAMVALQSWFFDLPTIYWAVASAFSVVVAAITYHFAETSRQGRALARSQEEIERLATQAERERIARDLHDLLGHTLSVVTLKAELASRLVEQDPARAAEEMRAVEGISRRALREVREAVTGYRATSLVEELDRSSPALRAAEIELIREEPLVEPDDGLRPIFNLALREALTNVARHSAAQRCRVRFERVADDWRLEVADDGRGGQAPEGAGLRGMRERVAAVGGTVERNGADGTRLVVTVPVTTAPVAQAAEPVAAKGLES
ncbi:MAG: sensor histidine kinase [Acidobacteriota bacterium]